MRGTMASGKKRPKKILAVALALLMMVMIVPAWVSAAQAEDAPTMPSVADEAGEQPGGEEDAETEDSDTEGEVDEDEAAQNEADEEQDAQQDDESADAADDDAESLTKDDEEAEQEESEFQLDGELAEELLDIEYLALPQSAEEVALLVEGFPYGGSTGEQEAFLNALPKWETAIDGEWLPKGWMQEKKGTAAQGFYWALNPDFQSFAFIFDHNSLKSFLTLAVNGAPKTGLLVNDIQLEAGINTSKNYNGHLLDGNNYIVYAPNSGRHLTLTLNNGSDISFKDIIFDGRGQAGGISITGYSSGLSSQVYMENVTVQNCVLTSRGTVYLKNIKGTVSDSSFSNNTAREGGGVYITGLGSLTFSNCRFEENKAQNGGGIYVNYNTSATSAQAVATFTGCSINANRSKDATQSQGIGMYVNNSYGTVSITNSSLNSNYMEGNGYGVGLYVENTTSLTIKRTEINENYGEGDAYGGAFFVEKGKFILRDSFVQNNQTQLFFGGGALYNRTFTTITATISNTDFTGNFTRERGESSGSTNGGGALGIISLSEMAMINNARTATTKVDIDGCNFVANRAAPSTEHAYGGAINIALMSTYDDVNIRNTNFERNSAAEGGALFVLALDMKRYDRNGIQPGYYMMDKVKLENCAFKYNVATVAGGAIGTEMMVHMASQTNYYNAIKGTGVSFIDNMAPTGHQLPTDAQAYGMIAYAVERQFGVDVLYSSNADPSRLPLTAPFVVNHTNKYYRTPYNNYDISQNYSSTVVTSGMYKFTYHANGADTYSGEPTFTFHLMPERQILLLSPDDGSMGFNMAGYNFVEWNTAYDGSGESYQPGDLKYLYTTDFDSNKEQVLYAIWEYNPGAFTVTYKSGQGDETYTDPVVSLVAPQRVLNTQETGFTTPEGFAFSHWEDSAGNVLRPGDEFLYDYSDLGTNYTLTAQWTEKPDFTLYLRYVDGEGNPLGSDVLTPNPREIYAGENEQVVIANNLASLTRYKALYYTVEGQSTKLSLADDAFTMTAAKDGTVLLVYCASTMLDIKVPTSMQFFAMSANGMDVYSPVYSFDNISDMPAEVSFAQLHTDGTGLESLQLGGDGIAFVEEAENPYEMHLTLEPDSKTTNNGFEDRFTGTNGKPGILPDSPYNDAVVAKLTGKLVKGEGNSGLGAFTIGGRYAGPYELTTRTPRVALQFHVSLLNDAEYE